MFEGFLDFGPGSGLQGVLISQVLVIPNPIPVTISDVGQRIVDDCFPGDAAEKPVHFLTGGIEFAKLLVN